MSVDLAKVSPSDLDTAREIMHRRLIDSQEFHSCLNCDHWRPNGDSKAADEELESRQTVLRKQVAEIERIKSDAASTSPEKKKELEARIGSARKLDQEIADFRNTRRKDLEDRALKARQAILAEIREVVDRVAKARGCDIVIDSSASVPGGLPVVVSASAGSDLSSEVLEMLNRAPSSGSGKAGGRTAP